MSQDNANFIQSHMKLLMHNSCYDTIESLEQRFYCD